MTPRLDFKVTIFFSASSKSKIVKDAYNDIYNILQYHVDRGAVLQLRLSFRFCDFVSSLRLFDRPTIDYPFLLLRLQTTFGNALTTTVTFIGGFSQSCPAATSRPTCHVCCRIKLSVRSLSRLELRPNIVLDESGFLKAASVHF